MSGNYLQFELTIVFLINDLDHPCLAFTAFEYY